MYRFDMQMQTDCYEDIELTQVCFGKYDLILNFSSGRDTSKSDFSISIQSRIATAIDGTHWNEDEDFRKHSDTLLQCLGHTCSSFRIKDEHTASLQFSNGASVMLHDESDQFESVIITQGNRTIVI